MGSVNDAVSEAEAPTEEVADLYEGSLGAEITQSGVSATLDHAYLSDFTFQEGDQEIAIIFYQITITNGTDQDLAAHYLSDSFYMVADGEAYPYAGLRAAKMITRQFGEDAEYFMEDLAPGETRQGYVYTELPADFTTSRLVYYPAASVGDRSAAYSFQLERDQLEAAPDPVTPLDAE